MKKNNKYNLIQYLFYSFLVYFVACFWYRDSFLREIWILSTDETLEVFYYIFFVSFLTHILLSSENQRNSTSILNVLIPCEIVTVLCYFNKIKYLAVSSTIVFILFSIAFTVWVFSGKIKTSDTKRQKKIIVLRLKKCLTVSKYTFIISFFVLLIAVLFFNYITPVIEQHKLEQFQNSEEAKLLSMEHQHKTLEPIQDEKLWSELNAERKEEILNIILKMEVEYLGLPHLVTLETVQDSDADRYGDYNDSEHIVTMYNIDKMTAKMALKTLLHELFHAAEHRFVDVFSKYVPKEYQDLHFFQKAWVYKYEFENYENNSDGDIESYLMYSTQFCERDADNFAEERSSFILTDVYRWVNGYETAGE